MAFLGLVPSERSTGDTRRQGGITKAGNSSARKALVEAAWTYRHSAGVEDDPAPPATAAAASARDCLESAEPVVRPLSTPHCEGEAQYRGDHRDRPRDRSLPVGNCTRGRTRVGHSTEDVSIGALTPIDQQGINASKEHNRCARLRDGTTVGTSRAPLGGQPRADARCKDGPARTETGNAVTNPRIRAGQPTSSGPVSCLAQLHPLPGVRTQGARDGQNATSHLEIGHESGSPASREWGIDWVTRRRGRLS